METHIRIWTQASGQGTFQELELSSGTLSAGFSQYDMVAGVSEEAATSTPQDFGHSFSCPFFPFFGSIEDPILDDSDPCCLDISTLLNGLDGLCGTGPSSGAGSTGPMEKPAAGTWTNSLNATGGGAGGGFGTTWLYPDPTIAETWD